MGVQEEVPRGQRPLTVGSGESLGRSRSRQKECRAVGELPAMLSFVLGQNRHVP